MATDYSAYTGDAGDLTLNNLEAALRIAEDDEDRLVRITDIDDILDALDAQYDDEYALSKSGPKQKHLIKKGGAKYKATYARKAASTAARRDYYRTVHGNFEDLGPVA